MTDDQQPAVEAATGDNVMGKVLGTFDGLVDNATAAVGGAASAVKDAGAGLVEKGGEVTGTLGEKATGAASGVGAVISDNFDAPCDHHESADRNVILSVMRKGRVQLALPSSLYRGGVWKAVCKAGRKPACPLKLQCAVRCSCLLILCYSPSSSNTLRADLKHSMACGTPQ